MQSDILNIHLIQFAPEWGEKEATLKRLETFVDSAIREGEANLPKSENTTQSTPRLVILPEMFSTAFKFREHLAETMEGETVQWMRDLAKAQNTAIYGSLLITENGKLYNRGLFIFPNGDYEQYDKRHRFCMSDEPKFITPGQKIVTVEYAGWRIRLSICYDLRFPVWNRNSCKDGQFEYDVLLNTASWADGRAHVWRTLLHARAIENQAYCIGVNRVGEDGEGYTYRGDSMIVDAKGTALAMANPNEEQAIFVQIKKKPLNEFRKNFRVSADWDSYEIKI
jgi:predicted amidohydrolase